MFPLDTQLEYHLRHNHYPPYPLRLVPVAKEAITRAQDGDWDTYIVLPDDLRFHDRRAVSVREAVETMHLEGFLAAAEFDGDPS